MRNFKEFGITATQKNLKGDKIKIERILNREITVEDYRIVKSKFENKGECLHLQLSINSSQHILFTGSIGLIETIKKIPEDGFPFLATIIRDNERFEFT